MNDSIRVGMAELKIVKKNEVLVSLGIGSCVVVALYDAVEKIAGLVHIMLPYCNKIKNNANPLKFADTGIAELIRRMVDAGADRKRLVAKIAGGAQMFSSLSSFNKEILTIGDRNVEAVIRTLGDNGIRIIAQETGGNYGRSIEFHSDSGMMVIRSIGHGSKEL